MRVFVAEQTAELEGDFSFTIPGELVHLPPLICDSANCGCERAVGGFVSHRATTNFVVRDLNMSPREYVDVFLETLRDGGWIRGSADVDWAVDFAKQHMEMAMELPTETPLRILDGEPTVKG